MDSAATFASNLVANFSLCAGTKVKGNTNVKDPTGQMLAGMDKMLADLVYLA